MPRSAAVRPATPVARPRCGARVTLVRVLIALLAAGPVVGSGGELDSLTSGATGPDQSPVAAAAAPADGPDSAGATEAGAVLAAGLGDQPRERSRLVLPAALVPGRAPAAPSASPSAWIPAPEPGLAPAVDANAGGGRAPPLDG